ncbi:transposase [Saprospira grandis]|uniref:transposase n=1 Tax=Saprospira grandis TaxID=1008 RepID=UPI0005645876|nr:transposase [Saprospira grandis]
MVVNLSKEFITEKILAFFPEKKLARKTKAPLWQIVKAIIYRLKTGCQWRELPIQSFFDEVLICWQTVYYYFNSWSESGIWQKVWIQFLAHENLV